MRIGEMLVRDGRLTEEQVEQALRVQAQSGGRFGTVLVEQGFIDLDTLTVYLGLELGIPIATGPALDRAKRNAVRCLRPEDAQRFRCIPIVVQDRNLIAAIDDPHDLEVLEELSRITGYRIVPRVAPEIRIFYYLERYYGVPRPPRFGAFGDSPRGNHKPESTLPAPPLPGLPPRAESPTPAPTPSPTLRTAEPAPDDTDVYEELEIDAADLLVELEEDEGEVAAEVNDRAEAAAATQPSAALERAEETYPPADLDETLEVIGSAAQRTAISRAIMAYANKLFETAALFIVRDNMAFGWKGFGPGLDLARIETMLIPLSAPSIFEMAVAADDVFTGPVFPGTLHKYLYKVLRCSRPSHAAVAVIRIGNRIVNVLYGHCEDGAPLSEADAEGLGKVAAAAGEAYVGLIAASKGKRLDKRARAEAAQKPKRVLVINEELTESSGDGEGAEDTEPDEDGDNSQQSN